MSWPAARAQLESLARAHPETVFVGIDGLAGAGKSTLAHYLADGLDRATVIAVDDFSGPTIAAWDWVRFGVQVVEPLRHGRPGRYQRWDWDRDAGAEWHDVAVGSVVLVEGVSATRVEVDVDWALRIWVETAAEVRRQRRVARDSPRRRRLWQQHWGPSEQAYVADQRPRERADLVVAGD